MLVFRQCYQQFNGCCPVLFVKVLNMKVFLNFLCLPCLKRTSLALDEGYSVLVRITVLGEQ